MNCLQGKRNAIFYVLLRNSSLTSSIFDVSPTYLSVSSKYSNERRYNWIAKLNSPRSYQKLPRSRFWSLKNPQENRKIHWYHTVKEIFHATFTDKCLKEPKKKNKANLPNWLSRIVWNIFKIVFFFKAQQLHRIDKLKLQSFQSIKIARINDTKLTKKQYIPWHWLESFSHYHLRWSNQLSRMQIEIHTKFRPLHQRSSMVWPYQHPAPLQRRPLERHSFVDLQRSSHSPI